MKINYEYTNELKEYMGMKPGDLVTNGNSGIWKVKNIIRQFKDGKETIPTMNLYKLYTQNGNKSPKSEQIYTRPTYTAYCRPFEQRLTTLAATIKTEEALLAKLQKIQDENKLSNQAGALATPQLQSTV